MITYTRHEKKFLCFKVWYGKTGRNFEQTLGIGVGRQKTPTIVRYALCINLIWVYFNIGFEKERSENGK